jgi:hypothetical protein
MLSPWQVVARAQVPHRGNEATVSGVIVVRTLNPAPAVIEEFGQQVEDLDGAESGDQCRYPNGSGTGPVA